ncbi:YigZ family protein [Senegalia massiliensis]|uniref:YigZ family protein n=1 Tax=Senegalia massiliensis TaxID=1720316 RepID=UPI0010319AE7|nr:YigZ family protein [Senegalia massiliensis]
MKDIFKTIHKFGEDYFLEKKSKFIGYAKPVESEEEALEFIEQIRTKHKDATHNVYAYAIGENNNIQRYSDDGEPSGIAGIPILEVIKKEDLRNIVVVVTRYFGGIKLGAGGLVRAYTHGAKIALESASIIEKIIYKKIKVRFDYTFNGKIENVINNSSYFIEDISYDDSVNMILLSRKEKLEDLKGLLLDITSGEVIIKELGEQYLSFENKKLIK